MEVPIFIYRILPQVGGGDFAETYLGRLIQDQAIAGVAQPPGENADFLKLVAHLRSGVLLDWLSLLDYTSQILHILLNLLNLLFFWRLQAMEVFCPRGHILLNVHPDELFNPSHGGLIERQTIAGL